MSTAKRALKPRPYIRSQLQPNRHGRDYRGDLHHFEQSKEIGPLIASEKYKAHELGEPDDRCDSKSQQEAREEHEVDDESQSQRVSCYEPVQTAF